MNYSTEDTNFEIIANVGRLFRKYRKALHLSQKDIQCKTGVSLFTISAFENGNGQGMSLAHFLLLLDSVGLVEGFADIIPDIPGIDPEKLWKNQK